MGLDLIRDCADPRGKGKNRTHLSVSFRKKGREMSDRLGGVGQGKPKKVVTHSLHCKKKCVSVREWWILQVGKGWAWVIQRHAKGWGGGWWWW